MVDTGFGEPDAERRAPARPIGADALATVGVDAATVTDVILTHLHYDHVGGSAQFPAARFHLQDREMAYATGRHMTRPPCNHAFTADHVAALVRAVCTRRVVFHAGDDELAPGLSLHLLGGHTDGLQVVRVRTAAGWLVLASDASHYYENIEAGRPFPIVFDVGAMVEGCDTLGALASDRRHRPRPRSARARALPGRRSGARGHRRPPRRGPRRRLIDGSSRLHDLPNRSCPRTSGATGRRRGRERSIGGQPGVGVRGSARSSRAILR